MFHVFSRVETFQKHPNCYLIVQSQQWKHDSNVWNIFEFSNIDTRATSLISFGCLCYLLANVMHCSSVSIVDTEQTNADWFCFDIHWMCHVCAIIWPKVLKRTIRLNEIAPEHSFRIVKMDMPLIQSNELHSLMVVIAHCLYQRSCSKLHSRLFDCAKYRQRGNYDHVKQLWFSDLRKFIYRKCLTRS